MSMKKGTKNLLMLGLVGWAAWQFLFKKQRRKMFGPAVRVARATELPTDSMAAGTTIPAAQGLVKEDGELKVIGG